MEYKTVSTFEFKFILKWPSGWKTANCVVQAVHLTISAEKVIRNEHNHPFRYSSFVNAIQTQNPDSDFLWYFYRLNPYQVIKYLLNRPYIVFLLHVAWRWNFFVFLATFRCYIRTRGGQTLHFEWSSRPFKVNDLPGGQTLHFEWSSVEVLTGKIVNEKCNIEFLLWSWTSQHY